VSRILAQIIQNDKGKKMPIGSLLLSGKKFLTPFAEEQEVD